eukprot:Nitzschia sp. Nitz4//scaffold35_size145790//111078//111662//NITZ4_003046-RA/size145790-processed-gene-0.243-mRNA-1//-1//CDS//3329549172//3716//frame0
MQSKNHYDILGVSKTASQDEIKKAFRKLSFLHHPDVNQDSDGEAFKHIANAHSVLSNPIERSRYDRQLSEQSFWRPRPPGQGGDWYEDRRSSWGSRGPRGPPPPKPAMHVVMETLQNPRYFMFSLIGFGMVYGTAAFLAGPPKDAQYHESRLVEAWKNPVSGQWEQPAPWDPVYRKLKPELELMPREQVRRRHV